MSTAASAPIQARGTANCVKCVSAVLATVLFVALCAMGHAVELGPALIGFGLYLALHIQSSFLKEWVVGGQASYKKMRKQGSKPIDSIRGTVASAAAAAQNTVRTLRRGVDVCAKRFRAELAQASVTITDAIDIVCDLVARAEAPVCLGI